MEIAVCVATYQRPQSLQALLGSLVHQQGMDGRFGIVVVDNDPAGSAGPIVDQFRGRGTPIHFEMEPEPGIPAARNRSIAMSRTTGASVVAFIDDDEFATQYWLATLYQRLELSGAAAVSGPVEPVFPDSAPRWARSTRLYHRATFTEGADLNYASTANSMLRLDAIAGDIAPFSSDFQFSGGSDSFLFQSIRAAGKRIVWEPNALVYEAIPRSRISMRWIVARSYRQGITLARCDRLIIPSSRKLVLRAIRGFLQFPLGAVECTLSLARKDQNWRRGVTRIARGAGVFAGLFGGTYDEYRRDEPTAGRGDRDKDPSNSTV